MRSSQDERHPSRAAGHRARRAEKPPFLEEGSSLLIALATVLVMSVVLAALASYAIAGQRSISAYEIEREERYAGDAAVKEAVNWVKGTADVARDPLLNASDPPCVFHSDAPDAEPMTVSCLADAGGGSGTPTEPGLSPTEGLLMLGTRKVSTTDPGASAGDSTGPYNVPTCTGWWDTVAGFFASGVDPNATGPGEWGAWFRGRTGTGFAGAACNALRTRTRSNFKVDGDLIATGRIQVSDGGTVTVVGGQARAGNGCAGGGLVCAGLGSRSGQTGDLTYLNGTGQGTDPGRNVPASPATNPTDIAEPWRAVGFTASGAVAPLGYPATTLMPSAMPTRTTGYVWSGGGLTASAACAGSAATIIFLPGWYRDPSVLNRYTGSTASTCKDVTFWFAPDPGPDGVLLTGDDRTGAYYFDFRTGTGQGCSGMLSHAARWCVGAASDANPRVVVGTPKGWAPIGAAPVDTSDPRPRIQQEISLAGTIDEDLSQSWSSAANAARIDGSAARYHADVCVFVCFSVDRAIRLRDFTPDVTSAPIDDVDSPRGRIYVDVAYGVTNPNAASAAKLEVRAVGEESGERDCGTYDLFTTKTDADHATGLHTYTFTSDQAKQLASACGTLDLINGLELTLKVAGNTANQPATDVYLDGMRIRYDTYEGANFPNPVGGVTTPQAAESDCDPAKAGAQLIFGGQSNVYVGDGSIEVCAGPYPTNPENHMSIGVYGVPAVADIYPTGITGYGGSNNVDAPLSPGNVSRIDRNEVTIRYGGCAAFCGPDFEEGWVDVAMAPYSPPAGYTVAKVEARVSYNPKNQGCSFLWSCTSSRAPQLQFPAAPGGCAAKDFPRNPDNGPLQVANWAPAAIYGGSTSNCITPAQLASGVTLRWAARAECSVGVCKVGGGQWSDTLDGIALQITLQPTDSTQPRLIPQSGCITAYPNYNGGEGYPDCAVVRADTNNASDNWSLPWDQREGQSRGRISVQGTVYAPSAAYEVDDTDVAYPLATRGMVVRHLRMSGFGFRNGYSGTAVGRETDKSPSAREATFTACVQTPARRAANTPCDAGAGDRVVTRARVRFGLQGGGATPVTADVPLIQWWSSDR